MSAPRSLFATLLAACHLAGLGFANAQLLEYRFEAVVDSVEATHPGFAANRLGVDVGETITGRILIDRSTIDQLAGDPTLATYRNYAPGGSSIYDPATQTYQQPARLYQTSLVLDLPLEQVTFGAVTTTGSGGNLVYDPYWDGSAPRLNVANGASYLTESGAFDEVSGDALNFYQSIREVWPFSGLASLKSQRSVDLLLHDSDGTAFSSDALPGSLALSDFADARIFYEIGVPPNSIQNPGSQLTSGTASFNARLVSLTAVPEPSGVMLGAMAATLFAFSRRRSAHR